jgi:hypothetical protein
MADEEKKPEETAGQPEAQGGAAEEPSPEREPGPETKPEPEPKAEEPAKAEEAPKAEPSVEAAEGAVAEAKRTVHDTAEKALHAGEELAHAVEKLGVRRTPVNVCKLIFAVGLIVYVLSGLCVRWSQVRAGAASREAQLFEAKVAELKSLPPAPMDPPNPQQFNWAFWEEEGGQMKADIPERETKWYEEEKKEMSERRKDYELDERKDASRRAYEMQKDFYRKGKSPETVGQELQREAHRKTVKAGPTRLGTLIRAVALLAMAVGALGVLFLGTEVEKAAALIVLGVGILRLLPL